MIRSASRCFRDTPTGTTRFCGIGSSRRLSMWMAKATWCWSCTRSGRRSGFRDAARAFRPTRVWRLPAGGRNHAVHARVYHHLAVMIERVPDGDHRQTAARALVVAERAFNHVELVFVGQAQHGFVRVDERILEERDHRVPGLNALRSVFALA